MAWGDARVRRQERKEATRKTRIEGRTARQAARQATTAEMAKHGMQRGQVLGDAFGTAVGAARDIMMPATPEGTEGKQKSKEDTPPADNTMMWIAGAAVAYFLLKRKK